MTKKSHLKQMAVLRKQQGISQAELAEAIGMNPNMIGRYERGDAWPSQAVIEKILDALQVTLPELLGESTPDTIETKALHREDLEAIRSVIREELERAQSPRRTKK